jgi:hypothetical protein
MSDDDDYRVGYGRPPRHTQFKPNQSGNPSGRPKGARSIRSDLQDELTQTVPITENGRSLDITKQRLVIKALIAKAAKGDVAAIGKLIPLVVDAFGLGEDAGAGAMPVADSDRAIIAAYMASRVRSTPGDDDG